MSAAEKSNLLPAESGPSDRAAGSVLSEGDTRFLRALRDFITEEKQLLRCPDVGPDENRYSIYSSVFNKLIGRTTAYKKLLLAIKTEYDDVIRAARRRSLEAPRTLQPSHLVTRRGRAAQLRDRISLLQRHTAGLQQQLQFQQQASRGRSSAHQSTDTLIPGLSLDVLGRPEALAGLLGRLQGERDALLARRRRCVPLKVRAGLDGELRAAEQQRELLSRKNHTLHFLYRRLQVVSVCLSGWEAKGQELPLADFLCSALEELDRSDAAEAAERGSDRDLFEDDEPTEVNESHFLSDYLDRFLSLFEAAQYEEAALLAACSPRGVLRNLDTMEMFRAAQGPPGVAPPLLRFFRALLVSVPAGGRLPAALSLQAVRCALQQGSVQLVSQAVSQHRLTPSEALGDALTEHAQNNTGSAPLCLALATAVYQACRLDRKCALSMCRRGLTHSAADFISRCPDFTAEDCVWLLSVSPSPSLLLRLLTEPRPGRPAILSVGGACGALLRRLRLQAAALRLLDGLRARGPGAVAEAVLQDGGGAEDDWTDVASLCAGLNRVSLSRDILTVLLRSGGPGGPEGPGGSGGPGGPGGRRFMEHIFL
ncbi:clathrin heavy chain linker domain-containing protein 1-like [Myripristis murdjan]|uniref:clathrin heavy chain linker domain-containing protein 1-like n=1 Tax=Myripristis murdjan TaxID=586833 RepID=UPI001175D5F5|nr:clathrin heavy chain linker domain-containing protein 1 [Myripristis murdjan]